MYELMVRDSFAAAHSLRGYKGKCEHTHGHNYIVEAYFKSKKLGPDGLAEDFTVLKDALKKILDSLDHKHLNEDVAFFRKNNTSAENIAQYIYSALKKAGKKVKVSKVCIYESENSMAAYSGEK
jgi:6-pyruvoyltetrahydropterin/6-carboxytetrahydropterin synthase